MKHYFYIVATIFWYFSLFFRHGFILIHLKFDHYESKYNGDGKGATSSTKSRKIYTIIDVDTHYSFADIKNTVYHEYRHAKQYKTLDLALLMRDQIFREKAPDEISDLAYFFSMLEIDARYYEQYKIWLPLEEIPQKVAAREKRGFTIWEACMITAAEYNVHELPNASNSQDTLQLN